MTWSLKTDTISLWVIYVHAAMKYGAVETSGRYNRTSVPSKDQCDSPKESLHNSGHHWRLRGMCRVTRGGLGRHCFRGHIRQNQDDRWRIICNVHGKTIGRAMYTPSHSFWFGPNAEMNSSLSLQVGLRCRQSWLEMTRLPPTRGVIYHPSSDRVYRHGDISVFRTAVTHSRGFGSDSTLGGRFV